MKKKEVVKKLALSRETLVRLSSEMKHVVGGAWSDGSVCPGTTTTQPETYTYTEKNC